MQHRLLRTWDAGRFAGCGPPAATLVVVASALGQLAAAVDRVRPARADGGVDRPRDLRLAERGTDGVEVREPDQAPVQRTEAENRSGGAIDSVEILPDAVLPTEHGSLLPAGTVGRLPPPVWGGGRL